MPDYCYVPTQNRTMLRIRFGSNQAETTEYKGLWPEALDLNLEIDVGADEAFAMFISYVFNSWSMYEYLSNLKLKDLIVLMNFVTTLVRTGPDSILPPVIVEKSQEKILH
jgi:hypothetical protein